MRQSRGHSLLFGLSIFMMVLAFEINTAHAAPVRMSLNPYDGGVTARVRVRRKRFRREKAINHDFVIRAWVGDDNGWKMLGTYDMTKHRWVRTFNTKSICGRSCCPKKIAIQLGMSRSRRRGFRGRGRRRRRRRGRLWWNRKSSQWQRGFTDLDTEVHEVICGTVTNDMPPGSLGKNVKIYLPAPEPNPVTTVPPVVPSQPVQVAPPPAVVPIRDFKSFLRSLKGVSIESNRLKALRSWTSRLRGLKVNMGAVAILVKQFTFDSNKVKASRILSPHVLKPVQTKDLVRLLQVFSHDSNRYKAAGFYCRWVSDSLNIHRLENTFSFESYKRKIRKNCR